MAESYTTDLIERVARAMVKSCGQRMFEDFDDPNAADDRDWWRARARAAIAEMEFARVQSDIPERTDGEAYRERIEELQAEVDDAICAYLSANGWKYTCKTPGSYWLWEKRLDDGRTILVNQANALGMQERME